MTDIKTKLAAWGAWVRSDSDKLGYHSNYERILALAPEHDVKDTQKRSNLPFMSDDEALLINTALSILQRSHAHLAACIKLRYVYELKASDISRLYFTPLEYDSAEQLALSWDDPSKKKVDQRHVGLMLREAERLVERYMM